MALTRVQLLDRAATAERLWLFLDYDGTLADFAPTPEHVEPDPELIELLTRLADHPRLRLTIVSGRRLAHVAELVPVPGILLAGTYGIELQTLQGELVNRVAHDTVRPILDALKEEWLSVIGDRQGFFLEDKGWALALHARFADQAEAKQVLAEAHRHAVKATAGGGLRVLGGHRFLELGPQLAHKGRTVAHLFEQYPWPGALLLYIGDDDKDEEAFGAIKERGGFAIVVAAEPRNTVADLRLESPVSVRRWLRSLLSRLDERVGASTQHRET